MVAATGRFKNLMMINKYRLPFCILLSLTFSLHYFDTASAYSYTDTKDPMANMFRSAIVAAKEGNWAKVSNLASKGIAMQENHIFNAEFLASRFESAIDEKDIPKTAEYFANLVYLSILEKLHRNRKENFKNFISSKARIGLALSSYRSILAGNIKKKDEFLSSLIMKEFHVLLASIGNPGFFGAAKKKSEPDKYDQALENIEGYIEEVFPSFGDRY